MCNSTLRMYRGSIPLCAILLTICFQFLLVSNVSSQAVACNNLVQVSLNEDCEATITPDMILEGSPANSDSDYLITLNGVTAPTVDIYTEGLFAVTVTYIPTGNSCWGEILVEDKLPPQIIMANCGFGTRVQDSYDDSDVVGASIALTTFGPSGGACEQLLGLAFPGQPLPPVNGFHVRSIPVNIPADGTYTFTPDVSGTLGCNMVFYLLPTGTFDPNDPCNGYIAPGGVGNTIGSIQPGVDYVLAGDYDLLVCQGPTGAPCSFTIDMTSDACNHPCNDLQLYLDGVFDFPPVVVENCGNYNCASSDILNTDQCGTTILSRTWICEDASGNVSDPYTHSLLFEPIDLAAIMPPRATVDLQCGIDYDPLSIYNYILDKTGNAIEAVESAFSTINGTSFREGITCNVAVTYSDQLVPICAPGCGDNNKIFRTWSIYDWCSASSIQFIQLIKASDTEKPTIIFDNTGPILVSVSPWGCDGTVNLPTPDVLHDNCDSSIDYTISGGIGVVINGNTASGLTLGDHEITYTATDCCGNFNSTTITISVVDQTAPVAVATQNIVVSLTSGGGSGIAKLYAESVDNGSHDGCTAVYFEVRRDTDLCGIVGNATYNNDGHTYDSFNDPDDGAYVKFCCEDIYGTNGVDEDNDGINDYGIVKVWLRVFDGYGNFNETWADVRVDDKLAPAILCPADIEIDCSDAISDLGLTGEAVAYNACNNAQVQYVDLGSISNCGLGAITRRWSVVGRSDIFCDQIITKTSYTPFNGNTIQWPGNIDTDCANLGFTGIPTYATGACDLVAYSMRSDTFLFESGACLKILNEFTVIDWCQYDVNNSNGSGIWSHTQVIKVSDDEQPVLADCEDKVFPASDISDVDGDGNLCEGRNIMLTNSASDLGVCASKWLKWEVDVDLWGDYVIDYTYSSSLLPSHPYYIAPTMNNQEVKITLPDVDASMSNHRVVWKVSDGCANATSCVTNFMITDNEPPTPYCVNLSTALMEAGTVELWACDFDLGAFDNCSDQDDLRFTFSSTSPDADPNYVPSLKCSSRQFTCNDLPTVPGEPITLQVYVWDEKDNYESCTVELTLVDNQNACNTNTVSTASISGRIAMEDGTAMDDVDVELMTEGVIGFPIVINTNINGVYTFNDNPMYLDYEISSDKNGSYMNGVSTLDLVLIQKHILNIESLSSAYKVIAADINHDDKITAIDLIELRKLILGLYTELPHNTSWRFVESSQNFLDDMHPFPVSEKIQLQSLDANMDEEGMIAIKVGDVNNNATTGLTSDVVSSRSSDLQFVIEEQNVVAGEMVSVAFIANDFEQVSGYQFTLEMSGLTFSNVNAGAIQLGESNFAQFENAITASWNEANAVSVGENEILFTMEFLATTNGKLSTMLNVTDRITTAEAYLSEGEVIKGLELGFRSENGIIATGFELYQNEPNPFANQTIIGFKLPEASSATLNIYNLSGKVIKSITADYGKGYNEIVLSRDDLDASGVIYYQLESGQFTAAKKMIIIK